MTLTNIPTQTIGRLSLLSGTVNRSGPAAAQTLTIANGAGNDFIVANGAILIQDATLENIVLAASANADISGTYGLVAFITLALTLP